MANWFVDYEGSAGAADGTSYANRAATIEAIATPAVGDVVRIKATAAATALGSSTWTNNSSTVTIPSSLTSNITLCENAWTASTNVTATLNNAVFKQGSNSSSLAIAAAFTTGLAAYFATGTIDLSGFNQISLWVRTNLAVAAGVLQIKLCSDTAGATPVNSIDLPAIQPTNTWHAVTVDTGGALGSSIKSVALYANSDPGTVTVLLDNILACLAPSSATCITLNSIISKNTTGEGWWSPQSINGTSLTLDKAINSLPSGAAVYRGVTETVATSVRACFMKNVTAVGTLCLTPPVTGTNAGLITYSGGWNRTDMSTRVDYTFFAGRNGAGVCFGTPAAKNYLKFEYVGSVRHTNGYLITANNSFEYFDNLHVTNSNGNSAASSGCYTLGVSNFWLTACSGGVNNTLGRNSSFSNGYIQSCSPTNAGMYSDGVSETYSNINLKQTGVIFQTFFGADQKFYNCTSSGGSSTFDFPQWNGNVTCFDCSWGEATRVSSQLTGSNIMVYSEKEGGTLGTNPIYSDGLTMGYDLGNTRWFMSPTSANRNSIYPGELLVAPGIACNANALVTVSAVIQRTNTGLTGKLVLKGGQIAGVDNDVTATAAGGANVDETLTITFTPTTTGVVDIVAQAYGGTTFSFYIKSLTVYQA